MTYKEKLLDPRWQKKRLEVLQRYNFTCQNCGDTKETLHIHHFCYHKSRNPWDSDLMDLNTLCASCHALEEHMKYNNSEQTLLETIKTKYEDFTQITCIVYTDDCKFYVIGFEFKQNILEIDKFVMPIGQFYDIQEKVAKWETFIQKFATNGKKIR